MRRCSLFLVFVMIATVLSVAAPVSPAGAQPDHVAEEAKESGKPGRSGAAPRVNPFEGDRPARAALPQVALTPSENRPEWSPGGPGVGLDRFDDEVGLGLRPDLGDRRDDFLPERGLSPLEFGIVDLDDLPPLVVTDVVGFDPAESVLIDELTTETRLVYQNPDGSITERMDVEPVRAFDEVTGAWVDLDLELSAGSDGKARPAVAAVPFEVVQRSAAGSPVLEFELDGVRFGFSVRNQNADREVVFDDRPGRGPIAEAPGRSGERGRDVEDRGSAARFGDLVGDGTALIVEATASGFKTTHEVPSLEAALVPIRESISVPDGWVARATEHSTIEIVDRTGAVRIVWQAGPVVDSGRYDPLDRSTWSMVNLELVAAGDGEIVVELGLDEEWLKSPDRVFPILVDPEITPPALGFDAAVASGYPNSNYGAAETLWSGHTSAYGTGLTRSLIWFAWNGEGTGIPVSDAKLWMRHPDSTSCAGTHVVVDQLSTSWNELTVDWNSSLSTVGTTAPAIWAYGSQGCPTDGGSVDVTSIVQNWANGATNAGFRVRSADEVVQNVTFKSYYSNNTTTGGFVKPFLEITYNPYGADYAFPATPPTPMPMPDDPSGDFGGVVGPGFLDPDHALIPVELSNFGELTWTDGAGSADYNLGYEATPVAGGAAFRPSSLTDYPGWNVETGEVFTNAGGVLHPIADAGLYDIRFDMHRATIGYFSGQGVAMSDPVRVRVSEPPTAALPVDNTALATTTVVNLVAEAPHTGQSGTWTPDNYEFWVGTTPDCLNGTSLISNPVSPSNSILVDGAELYGNGLTFYWCVRGQDTSLHPSSQWTHWSAPQRFFYLEENSGAALGNNGYSAWWGNVNTSLGNYSLTETDAVVHTPGPQLGITRTYNSMDIDPLNAFGPGWTSNLDIFAEPFDTDPAIAGDDLLVVTYPDGRREIYTKDTNGDWNPPEGYNSTLASAFGIYEITAVNQSKYIFDNAGRISAIHDPSGNHIDFEYTGPGGKLEFIRDSVSDRKLEIVWSSTAADAVVTYVKQDDGTQWVYGYNNDGNLVAACDPRNVYPINEHCKQYFWGDGNAAYGDQGRIIEFQDELGIAQQTVAHDDFGRAITVEDAAGNTTMFAYTQNASFEWVTSIEDRNSHDWEHISYGNFDQKSERSLTAGGTTAYTYNAEGLRDTITDANNNVATLEYNDDGQVTESTNAEGETTYYRYDANGNRTHECDGRTPNDTVTTYCVISSYDSTTNRILSRTAPGEDTETWSYVDPGENGEGLLNIHTSPTGVVTDYDYSPNGDVFKITTSFDSDGVQKTRIVLYGYDALGRLTLENDTSFLASTTYSYDAAGLPDFTLFPHVTTAGQAHQLKIDYTYTRDGLLESEVHSDEAGADLDRTTTYFYDNLRREYQVQYADGTVMSREFDAEGNITKVTDALGREIQTTYDDRNLPTVVTHLNFDDDPFDADTSTQHVMLSTTGYDPAGRATTVEDALNRVTVTVYDGADRVKAVYLQSFDDLDGSTRDVRITETDYNAAGLPEYIHEGGTYPGTPERTTGFTYTPSGRLETSTLTIDDGPDRVTTNTYGADGQLDETKIEEGTDSTTTLFEFDEAGNLVEERIDLAGQYLTTGYNFDARSNMESMTTPNGDVTTYAYDVLNRLTTTTSPAVPLDGSATTFVNPAVELGYDTFGNVTSTEDERGHVTTTEYDKLDRRTKITHPTYTPPGGTAIVATEHFDYDGVGNLTEQTDRRGFITYFAFDDLNRPIHQDDPPAEPGEPSSRWSTTYFHDGTVKSTTDPTGAVVDYTYDDLGRTRTMTETVRNVCTTTGGSGGAGTMSILFVAGSTTLSSDDQTLKSHLESNGHTVTVVDAAVATAADADGKDVVFISSSLDWHEAQTTFKTVTAGVILAEWSIADEMGLAGGGWHHTGQTQIDIVGTHPTAAGLTGTATVTSAPADFVYGYSLTGSQTDVANSTSNPNDKRIYAYDTDETLADATTATGRRVQSFVGEGTADVLNTDGWALVDAAFDWAGNSTGGGSGGAGVEPCPLASGGGGGGLMNVLFVANTPLNADDTAIKSHLETNGHTVTVVDDNAATAADATGNDVVFVSESVGWGTVDTTFKNVTQGVVHADWGSIDDMDLAGGAWRHAGQTSVVVVGTHPTAAGLSGSTAVTSTGTELNYSYSLPGTQTNAAEATGNASDKHIYAYESGETMANGFIAPGRRVASFLGNGAGANLTTDGWALVDAAFSWAANVTTGGGSGTTQNYTTTYNYDDVGNQTEIRTADAPQRTYTTGYDTAGRVTSVTDPDNQTTTTDQGLFGPIEVIDAETRKTTIGYDDAGRQETVNRHDSTGAIYSTVTLAYDANGNIDTETNERGYVTDYDYDALNRLTSVEVPITATTSMTTSYGYDEAGNTTRIIDGENETWAYTFNEWNLPEDTIEPATLAHPNLSDRQYQLTYDAAGLVAEDRQPGNVTVVHDYDQLGRLTSQVSGAAARTFGYDTLGRQTSIGHPAGDQTFAYDDRGLLTAATGPAGDATYAYDAAGRLVARNDNSGEYTFDWTPQDELETLTEAQTGITIGYTHDNTGLPDTISYPSGTRTLDYDDHGRLTLDSYNDGTGVVASHDYDYFPDDTLQQDISVLPGDTDTNTYTYDRAQRLDTWTHNAAVTNYDWDNNSNRTTAGTDTFSYDERNRLTNAAGDIWTWTPRGTLTNAGTTSFAFDGLGRMTQTNTGTATIDYTYDSLDRIAIRETTGFTYTGMWLDPTSDGTQTYLRGAAGILVGLDDGTQTTIATLNQHGDLNYLTNQTTGAITDTVTFDPFGDELTTTGTTNPNVGFQADWTETETGDTWQGARWYTPSTGTFRSRDIVYGQLRTPVSLNRYTYAGANPIRNFDPDGRDYCEGGGGGCGGVRLGDTNGDGFIGLGNSFVAETVKGSNPTYIWPEDRFFTQQDQKTAFNELREAFALAAENAGSCSSFLVPSQACKVGQSVEDFAQGLAVTASRAFWGGDVTRGNGVGEVGAIASSPLVQHVAVPAAEVGINSFDLVGVPATSGGDCLGSAAGGNRIISCVVTAIQLQLLAVASGAGSTNPADDVATTFVDDLARAVDDDIPSPSATGAGPDNPIDISSVGRSADEVTSINEYAARSNEWLATAGPQQIVGTAGPLRIQASAAANAEKSLAARTGVPYAGQAGHIPDTAVSGLADPPGGWLDMAGFSNQVCGGVLGSRIGDIVSVFTVDGGPPSC